MPNILVIHGAGMNMRGKALLDVFGPLTLPEYDARIRAYAMALDVAVEIFHSNSEGEVINRLFAAHDEAIDAVPRPSGRLLRPFPGGGDAYDSVRPPVVRNIRPAGPVFIVGRTACT